MAKKKIAVEERTEKLQIPVSRALADRLAEHAKAMNWTQANLAAALLEFAAEDFTKIARLLRTRVRTLSEKGENPGLLDTERNSEVRLQVPLVPSVIESIEVAADALNHTPVRLAALLLDCSLTDQRWFLKFFETKYGKAFLKVFGWKPKPYESAVAEE